MPAKCVCDGSCHSSYSAGCTCDVQGKGCACYTTCNGYVACNCDAMKYVPRSWVMMCYPQKLLERETTETIKSLIKKLKKKI